MEPIHDRIPVLLTEEHENDWLQKNDPTERKALLNPYADEGFKAFKMGVARSRCRHENGDRQCLREISQQRYRALEQGVDLGRIHVRALVQDSDVRGDDESGPSAGACDSMADELSVLMGGERSCNLYPPKGTLSGCISVRSYVDAVAPASIHSVSPLTSLSRTKR